MEISAKKATMRTQWTDNGQRTQHYGQIYGHQDGPELTDKKAQILAES